MKRMLIMSNTLYGGGAEKVLQTVINNLDSNKYDITLYSMHREIIDKTIYKQDFKYKVVFDVIHEENIIKSYIYSFLQKIKVYIFNHFSTKIFYSLCIREKYDIEIAFIEGESTKIIAGSNNKKSKKIAWVHIDLEENPWTDFLYKDTSDEAKHYSRFDKIICVSEATKIAFCRKYAISKNNVITHYNPIDANAIITRSKDLCNNSNIQEGVIQIVAVGRLVKQKGFDRLLVAINKLKESELKFHLHILGKGEEYSQLKEYIYRNNLQNVVSLVGYLVNPYSYMKKCDVLICSSRAEGYSLVVAEAMILGLAIITTNCSGPCELIDNGKYGIIVDNSVEGIYDGLKRIISDQDLLRKNKILSSQRSLIFNINKNIDELENIIDD